MTWLLKWYIKSRYFGFNRFYYKEFETFGDLEYFIKENKISNYDIYKYVGGE